MATSTAEGWGGGAARLLAGRGLAAFGHGPGVNACREHKGIAMAWGCAALSGVLPLAIQSLLLASLQQRLFKTGGRLIRHARYFTLQLAEAT